MKKMEIRQKMNVGCDRLKYLTRCASSRVVMTALIDFAFQLQSLLNHQGPVPMGR